MFAVYFMCLLVVASGFGAPTPSIQLNDSSSSNLEFQIILPNHDRIKIDLSLLLLKHQIYSDLNETTTTTTASTVEVEPVPYVTAEEAIEAFRQDLIKKEVNIAGYIESQHIFYRHFKLEFDGDKELRIRCSYDSNFERKSLKISCYEYREYKSERILSSGEIEHLTKYDTEFKSNYEMLNMRSVKQAYHMNIS